MRYWLMKSEPSDVSIDDLAAMPNQTVDWYGVRNYQARNFMRDQMQLGDGVLFYHSNCETPGIAGICEVSQLAYPDRLQFIKGHHYYDEKSTPENPRWLNVDVKLVQKTRLLSLKEMRETPELANLRILQRGNRLSITPVDPKDWQFIMDILKR
ncbi:MAG: EVE domain-containing protein [Methylotenera sp.]|mgnify:FL=1|jgi:predicted RNA-binding protein with PUA-like domain|nr:MAG: EVE domain-containing protein [Methylotenera sp.]PPD52219.1 MAG: EVE domain-containing protein [Methylotenera sp.]HNU66976.1 EVE domain-containing protein [Methylotenera sp.]HOY88129.1 EVE domain-containing protein [Methylotenera sp.]HPH08989.1 EVE domain-containing protein [Methylotenera sp.]